MDSVSFFRILVVLSFACFIHDAEGQGYVPPQTRTSKLLVKDFIRTHLEYPELALSKRTEGTVRLSFTIDDKGNVSDIRVMEKVSPAIDSAAIHLFKLLLWNPATAYGKAISSEHEFAVKFNIKRYRSWVKKRGYDKLPVPFRPVSSSLKIYGIKELDKLPEALLGQEYTNVQEYIASQLIMPDAAIKLHLAGKVKLRYIIEKNGLPSNIMVITPLGGGCTEEAIRVVQTIKWMPGIKNNEAVRTCYDMEFFFRPPDELKSKQIPNQSNSGL